MPLHLLLGLRTSTTPSRALHRRRMSLGMSLKYRHCSFGFQMGPSLNRNPVQSCSIGVSRSIRRSSSRSLTSIVSDPLSINVFSWTAPVRDAHGAIAAVHTEPEPHARENERENPAEHGDHLQRRTRSVLIHPCSHDRQHEAD